MRGRKIAFRSDACELAAVRREAREFLAACGFDECAAELLVLAIDEACTNVIRHAYGGACRPVRIAFEVAGDVLRVTLRDYGKSCDPSAIRSRDLEDIRPGGVGVHIIRQAFDTVRYEPCLRGTRLTLEKRLPAP